MKKFIQNYLPWLLVIILIIILIFFRCCNCKPGNDTTGNNKHDSLRVMKIKDISKNSPDKFKSPVTVNLNAIHRKGAGIYLSAGDSGQVWVTPNGGKNWVKGIWSGKENLYGAAVLSIDVMIAAGNKGRIIRSSNKGLNWDTVSSHTTKNIRSISFPDLNNGFAAGDSGLVLKTTDAGITWVTVPFLNTSTHFTSVCFINSTTGWFAGKGGALYKTINGGAVWIDQDSLHYATNSNLNCISFNSISRGTAVGDNGTILNTTNGGLNWSVHASPPANNLKGVHRVSNILSYIVGKGIIIRENNGIYSNIETDASNKYNAVDPSPYISGISVGDSGIMTGVNTIFCDDCNLKGNHDVMFLPPDEGEPSSHWKVRLRIYNNSLYDFKRFLRVVTPGFQLDHTVFSGWTQNDNTGTQINIESADVNSTNSRLRYNLINVNTGSTTNTEEIDVATLDMDKQQAGYVELYLTPIINNTFNNGSVEFYFGKIDNSVNGDTSFCYRVTYNLGEELHY